MDQLLLRERIILDSSNANQYLRNKKVLITGAAGSIGRELLTQILLSNPFKIVVIDHSELGMYQLQTSLKDYALIEFKIASITDREEMETIFQRFLPDLVLHSAAYKHVKLLEEQPEAAVKNNILGSQILADLALQYQVQKFIFVSTDKAVKPLSIMGISKRITELYLLELSKNIYSKTEFIITRFGNVLGSTGSVFHVFYNQIINHQTLTITDPNASRYFMTIPEAAQLILTATVLGRNGQIMIFDMGEPITIAELAKRMVERYGNKSNPNTIEIQWTGLGQGEKLNEELLNPEETIQDLYGGKIKVVSSRSDKFYNITALIGTLKKMLHSDDKAKLLSALRQPL